MIPFHCGESEASARTKFIFFSHTHTHTAAAVAKVFKCLQSPNAKIYFKDLQIFPFGSETVSHGKQGTKKERESLQKKKKKKEVGNVEDKTDLVGTKGTVVHRHTTIDSNKM